jgi:hypothetical protein
MAQTDEQSRMDFEQALGETVSEHVSPPVPFEDASPHECCEVVWEITGRDVTPGRLASLSESQVDALSRRFGETSNRSPPRPNASERRSTGPWRDGRSVPSASSTGLQATPHKDRGPSTRTGPDFCCLAGKPRKTSGRRGAP